jgi:hypothetical protein
LHLLEMMLVAELAAAPERLVSDGNGQSGP